MRKIHLTILMLIIFVPLFTGSCSQDREQQPAADGNVLRVRYEISGAQELTYGLAAEPHECRIDNMYTLFFNDATDLYEGAVRTTPGTSVSSGVSIVGLDGTGINVGNAYKLLFIANYDSFADTAPFASIGDYLNKDSGALAGKTLAQVKGLIKGKAEKRDDIKMPLLMSAESSKAAGVANNIVNINLQRRVARIDVTVDPALLPTKFKLHSAEIWNARTLAYAFGPTPDNTASAYQNRDQNQVITTTGEIKGKLYTLPNFVIASTQTDALTTCVIIGGYYNGSAALSYYRVNVTLTGTNQSLSPNFVYTVNIKDVTGAGCTGGPGCAINNNLQVKYDVNEWNNELLGQYTWDEHGNGLAVSKRNVVFSDSGDQYVELDVFTFNSPDASKVPSTGWTVGSVTGTDAARFTSAEVVGKLRIDALNENSGTTDFEAATSVSWGTITVPVGITQLSPVSSAKGFRLAPANVWFNKKTQTKPVMVDFMGNFAGITPDDVDVTVINYLGTGDGTQGWLTINKAAAVTPQGQLQLDITATAIPALLDLREAEVKIVVTQGTKIMTGILKIRQTLLDYTDSSFKKEIMMYCTYDGTSIGSNDNMYIKFMGMETEPKGWNNLHFSLTEKDILVYTMRIKSSFKWRMEYGSMLVQNNMVISKTIGGGDSNRMEEVTFKVKYDVMNDPAILESPWTSYVKLVFDDGSYEIINFHQTGVFAKITNKVTFARQNQRAPWGTGYDDNIYYYKTLDTGDYIMLDRDLGATTGDPTNTDFSKMGVIVSHASDPCPPGYRLLNAWDDDVFIETVYNNILISDNTGKINGLDVEYANTPFLKTGTGLNEIYIPFPRKNKANYTKVDNSDFTYYTTFDGYPLSYITRRESGGDYRVYEKGGIMLGMKAIPYEYYNVANVSNGYAWHAIGTLATAGNKNTTALITSSFVCRNCFGYNRFSKDSSWGDDEHPAASWQKIEAHDSKDIRELVPANDMRFGWKIRNTTPAFANSRINLEQELAVEDLALTNLSSFGNIYHNSVKEDEYYGGVNTNVRCFRKK